MIDASPFENQQQCPTCKTYYPAEPLPFYSGRPLLMKFRCLFGRHTPASAYSEWAACCVTRMRSNCPRCRTTRQ